MKRISYFLIDTRYDQLLQSTEMRADIASAVDYKRSAIRYGGLDAVKFTTLEQSDTTLILEAPGISRRMVVRITNLDEPAPIYESPEIDYDKIFEAERKQHEKEVKAIATLGDEERKRILERNERKKKESAEYLKRKREREAKKAEQQTLKIEPEKAKPGRPRLTDTRETRETLKQSAAGGIQSMILELGYFSAELKNLYEWVKYSESATGLKRIDSTVQQAQFQTAKIRSNLLESLEFCKRADAELMRPFSSDAEIRKNDERAKKLAEKSRIKGERQKERKNAAIAADNFSDLL